MYNREDEGSNDPDVTYFYDFIQLLEKEYAWGSVEAVSEDIKYAREVGPAIAGLEKRKGGVFILRTAIGRGHFAFVELEYDQANVLQPVMGGFLQE